MPAQFIVPILAVVVIGVILIGIWSELEINKKNTTNTKKNSNRNLFENDEEKFYDSFTNEIMKNPFIYPCCGNINDITVIVKKNLEEDGVCPHCGNGFDIGETRPDLVLLNLIKKKFN